MTDRVLILDFGSQFTQLIARRVRENGVYCEIFPCTVDPSRIEAFGADALILSGGEPMARRDCLDLARRAKRHGLYTALSSNGMPIVGETADKVAEVGFDYVGISLDGVGAVNDWFRGQAGAYQGALAGVRACVKRGVKVGLRFTLTADNRDELPKLLDLAEAEGVDKFYLSHLVYAGRGDKHRGEDADWSMTRDAMDFLIDRAWAAEIGRAHV